MVCSPGNYPTSCPVAKSQTNLHRDNIGHCSSQEDQDYIKEYKNKVQTTDTVHVFPQGVAIFEPYEVQLLNNKRL